MANDETSVGDLVINLTGDDLLGPHIDSAINRMDVLNSRAKVVGSSLSSLKSNLPKLTNNDLVDERNVVSGGASYRTMFLARHVANEAGRALGIEGAGDQATLFLQTMRTAGPVVGAVAISTSLIALGLKNARDAAIEIAEKQIDLNNQMGAAGRHYGDVARAQLLTTSLGKQQVQQTIEIRENSFKMFEEEGRRRREHDHSVLERAQTGFEGLIWGDGNTNEARAEGQYEQKQKLNRAMIKLARGFVQDDRDVALQRASASRQDALADAQANVMFEGPAKQRVQLERSILEERRKVLESNDDKLRAMHQANEQEIVNAIFENGSGGHVDIAAIRARQAKELREAQKDATKEEENLPKIEEARKAEERRKELEESIQTQNELNNAVVQLRIAGGASQIEAIKEAGRQRVEEMRRQGRSEEDIIKTQETNLIQQKAVTRAFARSELEKIHNARGIGMNLQDYGADLQAAVQNNELSTKDADMLFKRKALELGLGQRKAANVVGGQAEEGAALSSQVDLAAASRFGTDAQGKVVTVEDPYTKMIYEHIITKGGDLAIPLN